MRNPFIMKRRWDYSISFESIFKLNAEYEVAYNFSEISSGQRYLMTAIFEIEMETAHLFFKDMHHGLAALSRYFGA